MIDLAVLLFGVRATLRAAHLRWLAGVACGAGMLTVWTLLVLMGWYGRSVDDWGIHGAWLFAFFGPSAMVQSFELFATVASIFHHTTLMRGVGASLALVGVLSGHRQAERYSPLSDEAERWNRGALAFLPVLLLVGGELVFLILASLGANA